MDSPSAPLPIRSNENGFNESQAVGVLVEEPVVEEGKTLQTSPRFCEVLKSIFAASDAAGTCGGAWLLADGSMEIGTHVLVVDCVARPEGVEIAPAGRTQLVSHLADNPGRGLLGWVVSHHRGFATPTATEVRGSAVAGTNEYKAWGVLRS